MQKFIPTKEWIRNLKVGDLVPDCYGNMNKIESITEKGKDCNGKEYIICFLEFCNNITVCNMFTENVPRKIN